MSSSDEKQLVTLHWTDLYVETTRKRKLLNGVSGVVNPGELCALMGASGAGKTTLLNTLLRRNTNGLKIKGDVYANGQEVKRSITGISGYVQQEDLFLGSLTVEEHLNVQARMRLSATMNAHQRKERVKEVITSMLLENARKSRIGTPGIKKGISGGEMKRLSFATALLKQPPLLFCDEPTTGLDSHMALLVVKQLELLAAEGMTIVCTIHQPNPETFEIFDKVVFLCGGRVAYIGPPPEAVHFFASAGHLIPEHSNPANFFIQCLAVDPEHPEESKQQGTAICDAFESSDYYHNIEMEMEEAAKPRKLYSMPPPSVFTLIFALWKRYIIDNYRNPSVVVSKFVQKAFMAIFLGLLYLDHWETHPTQNGVQNLKGALFYYISELTYATLYGIQTYLPGDFPLLVREYHDGIFPTLSYYLARIFSYLPFFSLDGIIFISITYWMIGLTVNAGTFFLTLLIALLVELSSASLGVMICSITPSYSIAVSISGPILTLFSITGGIFTNVAAMPGWISWTQYLSWFRYGYESFIINEFGRNNSRYAEGEILCRIGTANWTKSIVAQDQCLKTGTEVVESLNFHEKNWYFNLGIMPIYVLVVYSIGYIGLLFRVQRAR
ncbi:unnamed protein product, partial [Mesorhabditis belari]|uniref:ABC transporter domain-containing protein n=1 Tax=Mesorhabditis belari TaxID=2138241 RepID=A0AAF3FCI2_9BILA